MFRITREVLTDTELLDTDGKSLPGIVCCKTGDDTLSVICCCETGDDTLSVICCDTVPSLLHDAISRGPNAVFRTSDADGVLADGSVLAPDGALAACPLTQFVISRGPNAPLGAA